MQLRTKEGYRAVHCRQCGQQERCSRNKCQCGQIWHQCGIHRIDPQMHASRKGLLRGTAEKSKEEEKRLSSRRKAPIIRVRTGHSQKKGGRKGKTKRNGTEEIHVRHVKFVASTNQPREEMVRRVRLRLAQQIAMRRNKEEVMRDISMCRKGESKSKSKEAEAKSEVGTRTGGAAITTRTSLKQLLLRQAESQQISRRDKQRKDPNKQTPNLKNSIQSAMKGGSRRQGHGYDGLPHGYSSTQQGKHVNAAIGRLIGHHGPR